MKRFWETVSVQEVETGWRVLLDGRPVRTPAKNLCDVPIELIAAEIAREWDAQAEEVDPLQMPMTRMAATCLDRVSPQRADVARSIAAYGETDLLCYRAEFPKALQDRQSEVWDPLLIWARTRLQAPLFVAEGVMHVSQPETSIDALSRNVHAIDPWHLTCLAEMTTISGSLILGLAVLHKHITPDHAWASSRIDEEWNVQEWGEDAEAAALAARRQADFLHAADVLSLLQAAD